MPIVGSSLTTGSSAVAGPYTTASVSPAANCLILCTVIGSANSNTAPTGVTGASLTWVQLSQGNDGSNRFCTIWGALSASPGSGALTITWTNSTFAVWTVEQFTNVDTSGTNGSGAVGQVANLFVAQGVSTGCTFAFTNPLGNQANVMYAAGRFSNVTTVTKDAAFTQINNFSGNCQYADEYALNKQTATWSWASQSILVVAAAVEIRAKATWSDALDIVNPRAAIDAMRAARHQVALEATSHPVIALNYQMAKTPTTLFFPRIHELPTARNYTVTLQSTTQPTQIYFYRIAVTPSTYMFHIITGIPVSRDVIGIVLRATTSPVQPRAPPAAPVAQTPSFWVQNPDCTLPDWW